MSDKSVIFIFYCSAPVVSIQENSGLPINIFGDPCCLLILICFVLWFNALKVCSGKNISFVSRNEAFYLFIYFLSIMCGRVANTLALQPHSLDCFWPFCMKFQLLPVCSGVSSVQ